MTEYFKKFTMAKDEVTVIDFGENEVFECKYSDEAKSLCNRLNDLDYEKYNLKKENEQLKKELNKLKKFEYGGEHIRLSINIETGELQRHIYATGQWFGDFDRVLCENWISKEDYQKFIDRVIEVYNTEFKR